VDVLAYHRYLSSRGALGPLGLFGADANAPLFDPAPRKSVISASLRADFKRDGWTDAQIAAF
jgi:hypothetical protein